jgi:hypothetical protein
MGRKQFDESRLLSARNRLSVREKEDILQKLLSQSPPGNDSSFRYRRWILSGALVAAVTVMGILIGIGDFSRTRTSPSKDQYQPRGSALAAILLKIRCVRSTDADRCRPGDKLAFQVRGTADKPWFAAFSTAAGNSSVVWYYPQTSDKRSIAWQTADSDGWLPEGFIIGENQMPGTHLMYGIFSRSPLTRKQIRMLFQDDIPADSAEIAVVTVSYEVGGKK